MADNFNLKSPIKTNILILKLTGLNPTSTSIKSTIYSYTFILTFIYSLPLFQTIYITSLLTNFQAFLSIFYLLMTEWAVVIKVYHFHRQLPLLQHLINQLDLHLFQPQTLQHRLILDKHTGFFRKMYRIFWVPIILTLIAWAVYPFFQNDDDYPLPFTVWYPWNYRAHGIWVYGATYVYQLFSIVAVALVNLNMDSMIAALMMYGAGQCDLLRLKLREGVVDLRGCVEHHWAILEWGVRVNRFLNVIGFVQFCVSSGVAALTMFQMTLVSPLSGEFFSILGYQGAVLVQLFMYCWFGNEFTIASNRLSYAIFESDWINAPMDLKKKICFFMMRAQKPIRMRTFNMFYLSVETFMKILQTVWSYFAMLRQVNSK